MDTSSSDVTTAVAHWPEMAKTVFVPHSEVDYCRLVTFLDGLIDEVGEEAAILIMKIAFLRALRKTTGDL